jgi:hypothetical protein
MGADRVSDGSGMAAPFHGPADVRAEAEPTLACAAGTAMDAGDARLAGDLVAPGPSG